MIYPLPTTDIIYRPIDKNLSTPNKRPVYRPRRYRFFSPSEGRKKHAKTRIRSTPSSGLPRSTNGQWSGRRLFFAMKISYKPLVSFAPRFFWSQISQAFRALPKTIKSLITSYL